jgi:hypothetical protein
MVEEVKPSEPNKYEPLGQMVAEEKRKCLTKVMVRCRDGAWLPEFVGDNITRVDLNRILKSVRTGYRHYLRMSHLQTRMQQSQTAEKKG